MADKKISDLGTATGKGLTDGALFEVVDVSDATMAASGTNKKITRLELVAGLATRATFSNANYTAAATDRYIAQTGTLTAARVVTLPAANAVPAGATITVIDESDSVTATNTIGVYTSKGTGNSDYDTIDGVVAGVASGTPTNWPIIRDAYGAFTFRSNGTAGWTVVSRKPSVDIQVITDTSTSPLPTWRKPFGCTRLRGVLIGGGGGGGGGNRQAATTNAFGGGGGQAGGMTSFEVSLADLSATETVQVGVGGTGGAAATTNGSNGGTPGTASASYFSGTTKWVARAGAAGGVGTTTAIGTGGSALGHGTTVGAAGGDGASSALAATAGDQGASSATGAPAPVIAPGGGGGGGCYYTTSPNVRAGAAGGKSSFGVNTLSLGLTGGTAGSGAAGGNGTNSSSISTNSAFGGSGGGGGGGRASGSAGYAGGNGGTYGAGGGGGAGSAGANSGKGGDGAQGVAILISS